MQDEIVEEVWQAAAIVFAAVVLGVLFAVDPPPETDDELEEVAVGLLLDLLLGFVQEVAENAVNRCFNRAIFQILACLALVLFPFLDQVLGLCHIFLHDFSRIILL